ncbi:MAG: CHASE2 domain-containing protein, partial [Deltaproteobacteria bacterium]|nr:CHASE2 domain-containing protein [Deltaproteobacteria bacterium]
MQKVLALIKRFAPLLIAGGIAFVFAVVHITIELGIFEYGPFGAKGYMRLLDLKALDMKFRSRDLESRPEPKVVVAAIDEKAIKKFGLWPWNRAVVADFIHATTQGGAKVIAFDAAFSDDDRNSAYATIKQFVESYQEAEIKPAKRLTKDIEVALKLDSYAEVLAGVDRALKQVKGPSKAGVAQAVADLKESVAKRQKNLETIRASLSDWSRRTGVFHERLQRQIDSVSPDDALAAAVATSPQTILGYIGFYEESAVTGLDPKEFESAFARLEPSAITRVYEIVTQDAGGQTVEMIRPAAHVRIEDLLVRDMVAVLA